MTAQRVRLIRLGLVLTLAVGLVVACLGAMAVADTVAPRIMVTPNPNFDVRVWVDRGEGATYYPGDRIRIFYKATQNCYVYILNKDTNGYYKWLLPSVWWSDNYVRANQTYELLQNRYNLTVDGPNGTEELYIFASTRDIRGDMPDLERSVRSGEFAPRIEINADVFIKELNARITVTPANNTASNRTYFYVGGRFSPPPPPPVVIAPIAREGYITITSNPWGARVFLDGEEIGTAPVYSRKVPFGAHEVTVIKPGYYIYHEKIDVRNTKTYYVNAYLRRID